MLIIKKLGPLSVGLVFGAIYLIIGLIVGVGSFFVLLVAPEQIGFGMAALILILMLILVPLLYGVLGFVVGIIMAALYNLVASRVGGIRVETEPTDHI